MAFPLCVAVVCALVGLTALPGVALAASGTLDTPSIAMGKDFPDADYKQVKAVLERKDCKFLGGHWLNKHTVLRYAGDTTAVNRFVEALSLCPNVEVRVLFFQPGPAGGDCDWMVTHYAPSNHLVVRINLASEKVKIENIYLPPVKAAKASE